MSAKLRLMVRLRLRLRASEASLEVCDVSIGSLDGGHEMSGLGSRLGKLMLMMMMMERSTWKSAEEKLLGEGQEEMA